MQSWRHWFNETVWVDSRGCVCVDDGVALNLLRRPLITVYPYNLSATTHFPKMCDVCACARLCSYFLYVQTSHIHVHLHVDTRRMRVHVALLFNERKWLEKNSDRCGSSQHIQTLNYYQGEESLITEGDGTRARKENMWAADETEEMRERTDAERQCEEAMDNSLY